MSRRRRSPHHRSNYRRTFARPLVAAALATLLVASVGCREEEKIYTITVSREIEEENAKLAAVWRDKAQAARKPEATAEAKPGRLLGALLPHGGQTWSFKILGDEAIVSRHVDAVRTFIESVKFDGDRPQWTLPAKWREETTPGAMRYATLFIEVEGGAKPLELAVMMLPGEQNVADNVNRWRGQVQLPPESAADAEKSAVELKTSAGPARWVDLTGEYVPGGGGMGPFMGGGARGPASGGPAMPADHPPFASGNPGGPASSPGGALPESPVKYELPSGWSPSPPSQFSVVAFNIVHEGKQARVTVSSASGDLLSNINRWRGQIQVPPIDQNTLDNVLTKMKVDGRDASYIELLGPAKPDGQASIYGVVVTDTPQSSWFVKMTGDASLNLRERERFLKFVASLMFPR